MKCVNENSLTVNRHHNGLQKQNDMKRKGDIAPNGENMKEVKERNATRQKEKEERQSIMIWKKPIITINYFGRELFLTAVSFAQRTLNYRKSLFTCVILLLSLTVLMNIKGPHELFMNLAKKKILWSLYWIGLGVLSSIGLGTGLHTFILYLGPHIASVTRAGYTCGALNFPEPPYPDSIMCPEDLDPFWLVSIWNIMRKVHLEAIMWGAGTALGELPPYFMARAARLSGHDPDDEDELKEFEDLQRKKENPEGLELLDKAKLIVEELVNRIGFLGILVCASIPNPLFDLAGITCGHFLIPFWTFFGATLIGKAVIKMMLQSMFVIVAFSDVLIEKLMFFFKNIPVFGLHLQNLLQKLLEIQKNKLHGDKSQLETNSNHLAFVFEMFVFFMVCYFVISIINSLAQSYHKRLCKTKNKQD